MRVAGLLVLSLLSTGCELIDAIQDPDDDDGGGGLPTQVQTNVPVFDLDLFVSSLEGHFDDRYAGAQIVVMQSGQLHDAWAVGTRTLGDTDDPPMSIDDRLPIASVSKVIGSLALLQVLDDQEIVLEQPIHNYLPESWKPTVHPDHFDAGSPYFISFQNLMRTETALVFPGDGSTAGPMPTADQMLAALQAPALDARDGVYQNGNFTLIRVLMCELALGIDAEDDDYDQLCSDAYTTYLNDNIFGPLGTLRVSHTRDSAPVSRGYAFPANATVPDGQGVLGVANWDSYPENAGSGGLYLSSMELAEFVAYLVHDDSELLLPGEVRDRMLEDELGFTTSRDGAFGRYIIKNGAKGPSQSRGWRSMVMIFPNDIEVVALTNSMDGNFGTWISDFYDAAWVTP